jgi:hypothetical protein
MSGPTPDVAEFDFAVHLAREVRRWRGQARAIRSGTTIYGRTVRECNRAARNAEALLRLIANAAVRSGAPS